MIRGSGEVSLIKFGLWILSFTFMPQAWGMVQLPSKSDAVIYFRALKDQNTARLKEVNETLVHKVDEAHLAIQIDQIDAEIEKLRTERNELAMRQDFLDRMIFQVDSHYNGTDLKQFLEDTLKAMAKVELNSTSEKSIWKFLNYLSLAISKNPEREDRLLAFVEGYMKQTSMIAPIAPDKYLASMAYSNGSQSEAANPMDRSDIGDYTDKRLKEIRVLEMRTRVQGP